MSARGITKRATLVAAIAERLDVRTAVDQELGKIKRDVAPEAVLDAIERGAPPDRWWQATGGRVQ